MAAPRPLPGAPRPLDPAGRWLAGKAHPPTRPRLTAPSLRARSPGSGADGCGPRTSLGQPLPAARRRHLARPLLAALRLRLLGLGLGFKSRLSSSQSRASSVGFMSLFDENELLRSHWYLYWGNIAYKQEAYSLSGENFFMSETENSCSRLCHPFFSRQKIPKSCNQRSLHLIDKATNKPKCLSMSTAACQTSSIATRCPV